MNCPQCGTENPEGAKFCLECGVKLPAVCPQCSSTLPPQAKFCNACGSPIGVPQDGVRPPEEDAFTQALQRLVPKEFAERLRATRGQAGKERRVVTILFCDVRGSTAMAEDLDPEDVMEIMDGAFDFLIEPVYRYEGTLARLMGDAILAFFGAPIAHEDDPERACRAALDIISGAREYAARLEAERGITGFNVRVGIHTGLVVVGEVGSDLRVEYTAMGDAINLASRMESAAEPGTVLITGDTYKLVAPLFEADSLGAVEVKGKAKPVPVFRVLSARAAPGKVRGIAGLESPLVGRRAEFAALEEAVARVQAGVGAIVTVVGEAGIGKSRLVAELRARAVVGAQHAAPLSAPLHWVEGRCLSYGSSIAYLLWLDIIRGLLGVSLEDPPLVVRDALREAAQALCVDHSVGPFDPVKDVVYPYLGRMLSLPLEEEVEATLANLEGGEIKARTFQAMETLLACAATEGPLVLLCEDLHWADSTSLELLKHLLALAGRLPLLFLCVFRPERERRVWRFRETIASEHQQRHTEVYLEALSTDEGETLVDNLLPAGGLPGALRDRILAHAGGNPFYLEEILRSLLDEGAIERDLETGRWRVTTEVSEITIPDTLQGVLVARIDRLQEETRRVLQMAAVIGRLFLYRVLEAIAREQRDLDARVQSLQQEEMIRERARLPELEYIFKHELTREAAYNGLLKRERRVFHRQVAEALERLYPDRVEEQVGLLAHHWERSGDAEKATEYLLRAGDQARLAYAYDEAIDYYQRALAFLRGGDDLERAARTVMRLGLTYHNAFRFQQARAAYDEGFALWQRAGEVEPAELPPAPHALRVPWYDPRTLDPREAGWFMEAMVLDQLFSGLVEITPALDIVPGVAQSWEVLEDGQEFLFHLREDARWSDGAPLTAGDFEYAWKRVLDPATASPAASTLYDLRGARAYNKGETSDPSRVGVQALNDLTLLVELEAPTGYFLHLLTYSACHPLPRHALEAHGEAWTEVENYVGNGPFRLDAWQSGELMAFSRNPAYHGQFRGNVQRVELLPILEEASAALEEYEAHALDVLDLGLFPPAMTDRARQQHAGEYISSPTLEHLHLCFDVSRPPFDDRRVRQAFVLASDRERLANEDLKGQFLPATGGYMPPGMPGYCPEIALPYDPDRARQLLVEAGYPGRRGFPLVDLVAGAGTRGAQANERLQRRWRDELGVEVSTEAVEWEAWEDRLLREPPHLITTGWIADYPDPDSFLRVAVGLHSLDAGWRNEAYDSLVERARRLTEQGERLELYRKAEQILVEEAPIVPLVYWRSHLLVKPWVRKYPTAAMGGWFWKDVIIESH